MFCPKCGTKNDDDAVFCGNCGARIEEDPVTPEQMQQEALKHETTQQDSAYEGQLNANADVPHISKAVKLSKKTVACIAAAVAAAAVVLIFFNVGKSVTDYKKTAQKYVAAVEEGDWEKAFSLLNLPEGEFLTKEAFAQVNDSGTKVEITDIASRDVTDVSGMLDEDEKILGAKYVAVTYAYAGSSSNTEYVMLDRLKSKWLIFFNQYKVSADGTVAFGSIIKVPSGSRLVINGVEASKSYIDESKSTEKQDYYVIPYVFQGDNLIRVENDYMETLEQTVDFYGKSDMYTVNISDMKFKEDIIESAKSQAKTDLEKLIAGAVAQKKFSETGVTSFASASTTLDSYYTNSIVTDCHSSYRDIKSLTVSDISQKVNSSNVSVDSSDGTPCIRVELNYKLTGTYVYRNNETVKEGKNNSATATLQYKYSDNQWKLYKMSMGVYIS